MFKPFRFFPVGILITITSCNHYTYDAQFGYTVGLNHHPSAQELHSARLLSADVNRNGKIDEADDASAPWSWKGQGAFVLPNVDDDDNDGIRDCEDERVNGQADEKDLTEFEVNLAALPSNGSSDMSLTLSASSPSAPVRLFKMTDSGWKAEANSIKIDRALAKRNSAHKFAVESCAFASPDWDGFLSVTLRLENSDLLQSLKFRVTPFLMIPNTEPAETLFISKDPTGRYENTQMIMELRIPLLLNGTLFRVNKTDVWQEMWMQDTMEIGYSASTSGRMHVVLNAPRGSDRYGPSLLGPDVGFIDVAKPRESGDAGDGWLDWFGNLEVSPPTAAFPHGRIYYGSNPQSGNSLHPDIVGFLEAQELQKPVGLDVSWLFIKHVDEMLSFWPDRKSGGFASIIPSPRRAAELLNGQTDDFNSSVQIHLDKLVNGTGLQPALRDIFGLQESGIIELPLSYDAGEHGAVGRWSNPVNSVALKSAVIFGRTDLPKAVNAEIKIAIGRLHLFPAGVDDGTYQSKLGNVHCATNSMRKIPSKPYWK